LSFVVASIALPGFTEWYFASVGPVGLLIGGSIAITVSLIAIGFRRRFVAVGLSSLSFLLGVVFLVGGIFSSIVPLLKMIRDMLPPESR